MVTDAQRRDLFEALERELGKGPAATLMELLPPVGFADLARQSDLVAVRGEISEVRGEIAEVRGEIAEVRGEVAELRAELKGEIAEVRGEIAGLSARIDAQVPRFVAANVPVMLGVAGLVLAAAKLA